MQLRMDSKNKPLIIGIAGGSGSGKTFFLNSFLHHFKNDQIIKLLTLFNENSRLGIVVNDLHRNEVAYRLFQMICFVFRMNKMSREDGLTSILRGFKKEELIAFSEKLSLKKFSVQWKWAFRYQWIVEK